METRLTGAPDTHQPTRANQRGNGTRPLHQAINELRDTDAELHLLGDLCFTLNHIDDTRTTLDPDAFTIPAHANIYAALLEARTAGMTIIDTTVIRHALKEHGTHTPDTDKILDQLAACTWGTGAWAKHATIVADHAHHRRLARAAYELAASTVAGDNITDRLDALDTARLPYTTPHQQRAVDVDDLLNEQDPEYDWLIPGLLERMDRVILTASEGSGKSTMLRQIAMRAAIGQHPFTGDPIDPLNVLYIDTENGRRHVRRQLRKLRHAAGDTYQPGRLRFQFRPDGIDLLKPVDTAWLTATITANQPDLLLIGPLYKMAAGDPIKEETARTVATVIDRLRATNRLTIIIEAHTPYADTTKGKRPIRPYGASLWSRWPEFGICLTDNGVIAHWRGQRDERGWPAALERSKPWPWTPRDTTAPEITETRSLECVEAIVQLLERHPTETFSGRKLATRLRDDDLSYRDETIRSSAEHAVAERRIALHYGPRNSHLYGANATQEDLFDPHT